MSKDLELWQFIASRLKKSEPVILLIVAESSGSSPGRAGYKMAVAADGELFGSIGGGVMEVSLVEQSRKIIDAESLGSRDAAVLEPGAAATGFPGSTIKELVHQKNSPIAYGMVCSGKQTIIFCLLTPEHTAAIDEIINKLETQTPASLTISQAGLAVTAEVAANFYFEKLSETDFKYQERLGPKNSLYIIGGGHCALALSEVMSKMDFHISIFDDRQELNTIEKNRFANEITIIDGYEKISELIPPGPNTYIVVMTLGYKSDQKVIRSLFDKDLKYFGVLGSKAKMKTLLKTLEKEGFSKEKLSRIYTPIGLAINSRTPEEIAVSIAAEIISVKNSGASKRESAADCANLVIYCTGWHYTRR